MSNGTTVWSYTYDSNGMRTIRTNGTATYQYVYNGSQLTQLAVGNSTLHFAYSGNRPITVRYNDCVYYYITNIQGDVIAILDEDGTAVVTYTYDAWGSTLSVNGTMATTLGQLNPLRYRGYVWDNETNLYYLQSRYYDPEVGRFLNSDTYAATGQGLLGNNMFAYCGNNPVLYTDEAGTFFFTALGAVTGFIGGAVTAMLTGEDEFEWFEIAVASAAGGAMAGAGVDIGLLLVGTFGTALPVVAMTVGSAFLAGGIGNAYTTYAVSDGAATDSDLTTSFVIGGAFNVLSFATSTGAAASSFSEIAYLGTQSFSTNLKTGLLIATSTSLATTYGMATASTRLSKQTSAFSIACV